VKGVFIVRRALAVAATLLFVGGCLEPAWQELKNEEAGFSIEMPGTPTFKTETMDTAIGPVTNNVYLLDGKRIAYYLSYVDYDESYVRTRTAYGVLEGACEGALKSVKGSLIRGQKKKVDGYPAREFVVNTGSPGQQYRGVLVLVGARMYQAAMVYPETMDKERIEHFFASFSISAKHAVVACRESEWLEHTNAGGRFSALFPGCPEHEEKATVSDSGPLISHVFSARDDVTSYLVSSSDYAAKALKVQSIETMLNRIREGYQSGGTYRVSSECESTLAGVPGRQLELEALQEGVLLSSRIAFVGNRLYQAVVARPKAMPVPENQKRFFDSIKVLSPSAP